MDYEFMEALEEYTGISLIEDSMYAAEARDAVNTLLAMEGEFDYEPAIEGNTADAAKGYRELSASVKEHKAEIREALGNNDYTKAATAAQAIAEKARELDAKIKNMPYDISGSLLVYIATTVLAAFITGAAAFGLGKLNVYGPKMNAAVKDRIGKLDQGGGYKLKNGNVAIGDFARSQIHKDAASAQGINAAYNAAGAIGIASIADAIRLATKAQKNPDDFTDNDRNLIIGAIRASAKGLIKKYDTLAAQYRGMKSSSATECWLFS